MVNITVEIAGMRVSKDPNSMLITYALGSCIAVMVYDPTKRVGGMIHYMLPLSTTAPKKAADNPAMFADTGVPALFEEMYRQGCQKKDLIVKVAGGGTINDDNGVFDIGKRNYTILRKLFWKAGVMIASEDVGGAKSRTTRLEINTGKVFVKSQSGEVEL
jgi:chemotaxis protein CheD